MIVMYTAWALAKNISATNTVDEGDQPADELTPLIPTDTRGRAIGLTDKFDIVDIYSVDLYKDEHVEDSDDELDDQEMKTNLEGRFAWFWRVYYLVA